MWVQLFLSRELGTSAHLIFAPVPCHAACVKVSQPLGYLNPNAPVAMQLVSGCLNPEP